MKKIFLPTVIDFVKNSLHTKESLQQIYSLIGKEVNIVPNYDRSKITYGRYAGQNRWEIEGYKHLLWFPTEDFCDYLTLSMEESNYVDNFLKEILVQINKKKLINET